MDECYLKQRETGERWLHMTGAVVKNPAGKIEGAIETWQDLTEYKQLERQLIQSQKMEAIGTLAAGIAYDFNNIISAIIGYAEIALMDTPEDAPGHHPITQILSAGLRARKLVDQILTFSRQTEINPKPIQMPLIVKETLELIRSLIPSTIEVKQEILSDALAMPMQPICIR